MGINKILRFTIIFLFTYSIISCKKSAKKDNIVQTSKSPQDSNSQILRITNQISEEKSINHVKDFYIAYLTYLNEGSDDFNFTNYLSNKLIEKINNVDYNMIINGQDHGKFDLNTLNVSKTSKNEVFKVEFIDLGYNVIVYTKVRVIDNNYKIIDITTTLEDVNETALQSVKKSDDYKNYALEYKINAGVYNEEIIYFIDYLEEDYIVFQITDPDKFYDYKCRQERVKDGVLLYYVDVGDEGNEDYKGDTSKPLMKIYKKGNDFFAKSTLIDNGKEVKLKEVESRY